MAPREADAASVAATFEGLVGPWVDEMYRAAAAMVGEADARDVTQEALLEHGAVSPGSAIRSASEHGSMPSSPTAVANTCARAAAGRASSPSSIGRRAPVVSAALVLVMAARRVCAVGALAGASGFAQQRPSSR
jgi:hypothetical protein